jgi:hypothetical protein
LHYFSIEDSGIYDFCYHSFRKWNYFSINLFCNNGTAVKRDDELAAWFEREVYPELVGVPGVEVLLNNRDLGVG